MSVQSVIGGVVVQETPPGTVGGGSVTVVVPPGGHDPGEVTVVIPPPPLTVTVEPGDPGPVTVTVPGGPPSVTVMPGSVTVTVSGGPPLVTVTVEPGKPGLVTVIVPGGPPLVMVTVSTGGHVGEASVGPTGVEPLPVHALHEVVSCLGNRGLALASRLLNVSHEAVMGSCIGPYLKPEPASRTCWRLLKCMISETFAEGW